jgi:hypothetical protein
MHTDFCAAIRAQAHALVILARQQSDDKLALRLETIALDLLEAVHLYEIKVRL